MNHDAHGMIIFEFTLPILAARSIVDLGHEPVIGFKKGFGGQKAVALKVLIPGEKRCRGDATEHSFRPVRSGEPNALAVEELVVIEECELSHANLRYAVLCQSPSLNPRGSS
jgi:hypothetical protein